MNTAPREPDYARLTVAQARTMRGDEARLAASYAQRAVRALADGRRRPAARWTAAYMLSADRCRRLGQHIRGDLSPAAGNGEAAAWARSSAAAGPRSMDRPR